ncbi:MAG: cyanophycin synthetase [Bacteroidota bacterium]|nr:cyanophycin synthetase [Bacteroidota bacterium]
MDFYEAIVSFSGASKRLEKIASHKSSVVFKDFSHAPSKVSATTAAVKHQYPNKRLLACLELHTYSSLNESFIKEYKNTLDKADEAVVFYYTKAQEKKKMNTLKPEHKSNGFL